MDSLETSLMCQVSLRAPTDAAPAADGVLVLPAIGHHLVPEADPLDVWGQHVLQRGNEKRIVSRLGHLGETCGQSEVT
jgi:hypothetical protein